MSCSYQLIVIIGYELVSSLLFYSSARCVTFKELFVCKSSYLIRDFDINSRFLSPHSYEFSVKAVLSVGTPLPKTSLEQTCADYRIAGEKGIASRLNDV